MEYHPNVRDEVHIAYLQKGPCQPRIESFSQTKFGKVYRRFISAWFDEYSDWLEYSESKNGAFCLHYYLFRTNHSEQGGRDHFVVQGFDNWKKKEQIR